MLLLLVLVEVAARPPLESDAQARASVRIERAAAIAGKDEWDKAPRHNRREINRKEPDGRTVTVRVIEHE